MDIGRTKILFVLVWNLGQAVKEKGHRRRDGAKRIFALPYLEKNTIAGLIIWKAGS
jgi:hypothetical protein